MTLCDIYEANSQHWVVTCKRKSKPRVANIAPIADITHLPMGEGRVYIYVNLKSTDSKEVYLGDNLRLDASCIV